MDIIVDVDCTVADLVGGILKITGQTDRKVANKYDWFENEPKEVRDAVRECMSNWKWWGTLPLIENAREGINYLREQGHKLIWVTAPYKTETCLGWYDGREHWLQDQFDIDKHNEIYIPTRHKYLIKALAIIDDHVDWVKEYEDHNPDSIGFVFGTELNSSYNIERFDWKRIMSMEFFRRRKTYAQFT